ncbi:hypothetical protein BKA62DRAFT_654867 [Auriculariales sp. MPI-PUGE-AT-0066]|nr:hypothetical protein BKA62DRAFT_654867 [Auriculariales sp. MPI-PUGE-AT-0066]
MADDDSSDGDVEEPSVSNGVTYSALGEDAPTQDIISTFVPTLGQNLIPLQAEALAALGLQNPSCLIIMQPEETLSLTGTASLLVLQGHISLDAVTIHASQVQHRLFAPTCHPTPCIRAGRSESKLNYSLPAYITDLIPTSSAALILSELHSGITGLSDVCRRFDDAFRPRRDVCSPLPITGVSLVEHASRRIQPFILPKSWQLGLERLDAEMSQENGDPLVIMVKGGKRSGKSTLARTILNRLVTRYGRVAYLECDVGQSEFTPAGMVALNVIDRPQFGPSFTHIAEPHLAHYTGSTTARTNPSHYLACVSSCLQAYTADLQHSFESNVGVVGRISDVIPLVINTHGWNKGLGADLTWKIQDMITVSDIFDFDLESRAAKHTQGMQNNIREPRLHLVSPVESRLSASFSAADFRILNILSYFYAIGGSEARWDASLPMCAMSPWEVSLKDAIDAVVLACPGGEDVPSCELHTAINGGIVALVSAELGALDFPTNASLDIETTYVKGTPAPSPLLSHCLGLAVIRYASPDRPATLHLLTPIPLDQLAKCRVLVKGELELPIWAWLDHRGIDGRVAGVQREQVPYLQWDSGEGLGATRRRIRRNLMRWGQRTG